MLNCSDGANDTPVNNRRTAISRPCSANAQRRFRQWQDWRCAEPPSRRQQATHAARDGGTCGAGVTAAACGKPPPPPDLDDLVYAARPGPRDSQLASDAAATATPAAAARADHAVASERSDHAQALSDEIARLTGEATTSTPADDDQHAQATAPTAKDVVAALRKSADSAGAAGGPDVRLPGRAARFHRRIVHGGLHGGTGARSEVRRRDLGRTHADDDVFAGGRTDQPVAAAGRRCRRLVRRGDHRARRHLRLRAGVGAFHSRRQRPGVDGDGRTPRTARGRDRDARRPLGGPAAACRRAISCRRRSTTRPMPRTSRCAWKRTPRLRGGRCSSRRPPARGGPSR